MRVSTHKEVNSSLLNCHLWAVFVPFQAHKLKFNPQNHFNKSNIIFQLVQEALHVASIHNTVSLHLPSTLKSCDVLQQFGQGQVAVDASLTLRSSSYFHLAGDSGKKHSV